MKVVGSHGIAMFTGGFRCLQLAVRRCEPHVDGLGRPVPRPAMSKTWILQEADVFMALLHPGRLTWNLQITHLERTMIFQTSMLIFRGVRETNG